MHVKDVVISFLYRYEIWAVTSPCSRQIGISRTPQNAMLHGSKCDPSEKLSFVKESINKGCDISLHDQFMQLERSAAGDVVLVQPRMMCGAFSISAITWM